jgi:uncharacterized repeat protein (TIGR03803 family)
MERVVSFLSKLNRGKRPCAVFALCTIAAIGLPAQTFTTLHRFQYSQGAFPYAGLVQATTGDFYGTTSTGEGNLQYGTIFKVNPGGTLTTLYSFHGTDGASPSGLVQATSGDFYGTTYLGGASCPGDHICGTVFRMTPSGALTTLYNFCSQSGCTDGAGPGALVLGTDGNLYGGTVAGGTSESGGTVFKITPSGTMTILHRFNFTDGASPDGLVQAADGNFYGITGGGGSDCVPSVYSYCGTFFKISPSGVLTTLYGFCTQSGCPDGAGPRGLLQATNGEFYGGTVYGGANGVFGTIFKITTSGTLTTLYSFNGTDGIGFSGMVQATDGDFYGITPGPSFGSIFKLTPAGTLTTLYTFCSQLVDNLCVDGVDAESGPIQATNGSFYGTTRVGGVRHDSHCEGGCGTVFSLSVGLGPFVKTLPAYGKVGAAIRILGSDLTGATSVSFNGTEAVFEVVSNSQIAVMVPAGASSGSVQVVIAGGTLSSNVPFQVLP